MRGLVADDEEGIRNVIREYLEFDGHTVAEAANGAEAVSLCRMQKFDFIVMDIMMPVMDGFAACREIRRGDPSVPVLMLSARGEEYDKLKGFQLGIDDYVVKPFSPRELVARLGAICARSARAQDGGAVRPAAFGGLEVDPAGRSVRVICSLPWCRTRASSSRGNSCCARCGEMIFWETTGRWIPTSRCSAARWGPTAASS